MTEVTDDQKVYKDMDKFLAKLDPPLTRKNRLLKYKSISQNKFTILKVECNKFFDLHHPLCSTVLKKTHSNKYILHLKQRMKTFQIFKNFPQVESILSHNSKKGFYPVLGNLNSFKKKRRSNPIIKKLEKKEEPQNSKTNLNSEEKLEKISGEKKQEKENKIESEIKVDIEKELFEPNNSFSENNHSHNQEDNNNNLVKESINKENNGSVEEVQNIEDFSEDNSKEEEKWSPERNFRKKIKKKGRQKKNKGRKKRKTERKPQKFLQRIEDEQDEVETLSNTKQMDIEEILSENAIDLRENSLEAQKIEDLKEEITKIDQEFGQLHSEYEKTMQNIVGLKNKIASNQNEIKMLQQASLTRNRVKNSILSRYIDSTEIIFFYVETFVIVGKNQDGEITDTETIPFEIALANQFGNKLFHAYFGSWESETNIQWNKKKIEAVEKLRKMKLREKAISEKSTTPIEFIRKILTEPAFPVKSFSLVGYDIEKQVNCLENCAIALNSISEAMIDLAFHFKNEIGKNDLASRYFECFRVKPEEKEAVFENAVKKTVAISQIWNYQRPNLDISELIISSF